MLFLLGVGLGRLQAFLLSQSLLCLSSIVKSSAQPEGREGPLAGYGLYPLGLASSLPGAYLGIMGSLQAGLRWELPNPFPPQESHLSARDQPIESLALGPGRTEKTNGSFVFEVKGRLDRPLWWRT